MAMSFGRTDMKKSHVFYEVVGDAYDYYPSRKKALSVAMDWSKQNKQRIVIVKELVFNEELTTKSLVVAALSRNFEVTNIAAFRQGKRLKSWWDTL